MVLTAPFNSANLRWDCASCFKTTFVSISCLRGNVGMIYMIKFFIQRYKLIQKPYQFPFHILVDVAVTSECFAAFLVSTQ